MTYEEEKGMFDVAVQATPEDPEDKRAPLATIKYLDSFQGTLIIPGWMSARTHGYYPLTRAFRILKELKKDKRETHFYIDV